MSQGDSFTPCKPFAQVGRGRAPAKTAGAKTPLNRRLVADFKSFRPYVGVKKQPIAIKIVVTEIRTGLQMADNALAGGGMTPSHDLVHEVLGAFADDGHLVRAAELYRPRAGQRAMAAAVARAIAQGGRLVVEAGTGIGKTFAYLVPALLSGERVLISTATKTLQDQLFGRDLPRVAQALGVPVRTALLKGRASYLCLHRLELARQALAPGERAAERTLA